VAEGEIEESELSHNNAAILSPGHMNVTKRVYVLMLSLIIVLSGCLGGTTNGEEEEEDGDTTIINNYWNNTTTTTIAPEPEIFATNLSGEYWRYTYLRINQSAGEAIHMLEFSGSAGEPPVRQVDIFKITTTCGEIRWSESNYGEQTDTLSDMWLAGAGLDCTHVITAIVMDYDGSISDDDVEVNLSMVYHRHAVTIE
jgi:hypothetical protein